VPSLNALASGRSPQATGTRRFLAVASLGVLGITGLLLSPPPAAVLVAAPELAALPPWAQRAVLALNPLLLVLAAAALGAVCAHRVGLGSLVAGTAIRPSRLQTWLQALGWGLAVGVAVGALDRLWTPWLGEAWQAWVQTSAAAPRATTLIQGVLYGGLAEEVIARWGLMSASAWTLLRLMGPQRRGWAIGLAIGLSALAFGAAHLPALAAQVELNAALVARTLVLNGLGGVVFGWLFWRHHLEAAMVAHAASHQGLWAAQVGHGVLAMA
jgi:hypothetical protein